ncbi:MAG: L-glyceraldehyde 3-phosphate reductase [Sulfobacillus acidophilus]|uniref:L-glyceraldehyde 3-phosphate reductase n=1 Tax=Sulfobacillus acidophilus TaxID=53633 RepID=A0A2T2WP08_9FIRM|nr:MAG: L-glyceraldehyde 3-phosphate reductase [Sulfobacillus acidophilus]
MPYTASSTRYDTMLYRRAGHSGLLLPALSLGFWHNFGDVDPYQSARDIARRAFDRGITHFDLANNYGPPPGSAEETLGRLIKQDFGPYRDELIISTKAGWDMWPGPYGEWGSKKYLLASLDQSLKRMGLDYVDIFYSHRPDPNTPFEETMEALAQAVRQGKALYVGISSYSPQDTEACIKILDRYGLHLLLHQPSYSMLDRWIEDGLTTVLKRHGIGTIVFSPLAQGILTGRYLHGIPQDSRAGRPGEFLNPQDITTDLINTVRQLSVIATERGQTMAQMALAWVLRDPVVTSAIIGASRVAQVDENIDALAHLTFTEEEWTRIDHILSAPSV